MSRKRGSITIAGEESIMEEMNPTVNFNTSGMQSRQQLLGQDQQGETTGEVLEVGVINQPQSTEIT